MENGINTKNNNTDVQEKIATEQMRMLYRNLPFNTLLHVTAGFILCALLWTRGDRESLLAWWLILAVVSLLRLGCFVYFQRREKIYKRRFWNGLFGAGALLAGLMWGLGGVYLTPHDNISYELFVGFIVAGMAMGAVPVLSSVKEVYFVFALSADLPYIFHIFQHAGDIYTAVAIIQSIFLLLMLVVSVRIYRLIRESLLLRFYNVDLVEKLQSSNDLLVGEVESHKYTADTLRENDQRLNAIVDATFEGIILHRNGEIVEVNRGMAMMTGYAVNEMIGRQVKEFIAPNFQNEFLLYIQSPPTTRLESEVINKKGDYFPVEIRAGFVPYRGSKVAYVVVRDITYYKEMLKSQSLARKKAEDADQSKTEFLAAVSHELRTPLNAVMGFTQLLQDTSLTDEQKEYLAMTYRSGEQLLSLINELLDLSRIESGKFDLDLISFNLMAELNDIMNLMSLKLAESGNLIKLEFSDNLPELIISDPLRLRQVLINLLGNAIKFTSDGEIEFTAFANNSLLSFVIKDNGQGIPEDKLDFIFGKFNQVDASVSRQHGGAGLGLAISKRLVEAMGGSISVISKLNEGTSFRIDLPLEISKTSQFESEPVMLKEEQTDYRQSQALEILLVEDDKTNQKIAIAMLEKMGHHITVAENGQQAIDQCEKNNRFAVIFMDIQMPVMDGLAATKKLREIGIHTPIVAMTANAMVGDQEDYLQAGMNDYISKPIYKDVLLKCLSQYTES